MITIEDFTLLPVGFVVALEGRVVRCPRCGRNGVLKCPEEAAPFCIHAEETSVLGDGMRTDPTDCCELPEA